MTRISIDACHESTRIKMFIAKYWGVVHKICRPGRGGPGVSLKRRFDRCTLLNKKSQQGGGGQKSPIVRRHSLWMAPDVQRSCWMTFALASTVQSFWRVFFCYEKFSHHDVSNKAVDKWHDMHQHFNSDNNLWFYNHLSHFLERFQFAMNDKLSKRTILPFELLDL